MSISGPDARSDQYFITLLRGIDGPLDGRNVLRNGDDLGQTGMTTARHQQESECMVQP